MDKQCKHKRVRVYRRLVAAATYYEPACYMYWAVCEECGESMDYDDVPNDSERIDN